MITTILKVLGIYFIGFITGLIIGMDIKDFINRQKLKNKLNKIKNGI